MHSEFGFYFCNVDLAFSFLAYNENQSCELTRRFLHFLEGTTDSLNFLNQFQDAIKDDRS